MGGLRGANLLGALLGALAQEALELKLKPVPAYKLVNLLAEEDNFLTSDKTPIVFMHGMGDSGSNFGMRQMCKDTAKRYSTYVVCLDVADSTASIYTKAEDQVAEMNRILSKDERLKGGFNMMGLSQGGLMARAYVEKYNNPPVKKLVSFNGTQNGIATCPTALSAVCFLWDKFLNPYETPLVFSDYWKDPTDQKKYLAENRFLPDLNNEKPEKNDTYKKNMVNLDSYLMVEALGDNMVIPHESETHGFTKWGENDVRHTEKYTETQAYQEDWLGLKTLDEAGKLHVLTFDGDHLHPNERGYLRNKIIPYLAPDEQEKQQPELYV